MDDAGNGAKADDEREIALIDSLRERGSAEDARQRLNGTARAIAEKIVATVPGQTWKFVDNDPYGGMDYVFKGGSFCADLSPAIAWRPASDRVVFGRTFAAEEFTVAVGVVRAQAATDGATADSAMFDDPSRRDYSVTGNGYEFTLAQIDVATLEITGDCFLLQKVLDLPAGQLPPPPPIVPTP